MIPANGTITKKIEKELVKEAVKYLTNPNKWNYHIRQFEEEFAEYIGTRYALAVCNGTAALHLALLSLDIGVGDEVILPNLGFVSAAFAVSYTGAKPVFADVELGKWTLNPINLPVTKRTKAIMPVYMYGQRPDIEALRVYGVPIIEDACPAIGTLGVGLGEVSCFSFQGAKTLAIGEGGMVVTNNKDVYERAKKLANLGKATADFYYDEIGYNYRISNIQAALGLGQLRHIDELLEKKKKINKWYGEWCSQQFDEFSTPWTNSYMFKKNETWPNERDEIREHLKERLIETRNVFPLMSSYPMYEQNVYTPWAKKIATTGINLPSATYLQRKDIDYVKRSLTTYYRK